MHKLLALAAVLLLGGCATTGTTTNNDPWEGMNRGTFAFNDALDRAILKPVAQGYQAIVPPFFQARITNFFANIEDIATGANNILQGKAGDGFNDWGRVLCNTTIGVLGFFDVASENGAEKHNEDFGQTLAVWGVSSGPYLVIPLLGPSTLRDAPARAVDPSWYYSSTMDSTTYWSLWTLDKVQTRAGLLKAESVIEGAALDRYTFIRDAWIQRRNSQVYDGHPPRPKEEE